MLHCLSVSWHRSRASYKMFVTAALASLSTTVQYRSHNFLARTLLSCLFILLFICSPAHGASFSSPSLNPFFLAHSIAHSYYLPSDPSSFSPLPTVCTHNNKDIITLHIYTLMALWHENSLISSDTQCPTLVTCLFLLIHLRLLKFSHSHQVQQLLWFTLAINPLTLAVYK